MAGSFAAILTPGGGFTVANLADASDRRQALEQCHQIIALLVTQIPGVEPNNAVRDACIALGFAVPGTPPDYTVPVVQPELTGPSSVYREADTDPADYLLWSSSALGGHDAWWKANRAGYTANINDAGRYTYKEARQIVGIAEGSSKSVIVKAPEAVRAGGA